MEVMSTLLIVGVMDDARADITGNGNIQLTSAELLSQVCVSIIYNNPDFIAVGTKSDPCLQCKSLTKCLGKAWFGFYVLNEQFGEHHRPGKCRGCPLLYIALTC